MAVTDPIGDLLTRIRNGQLRGLAKISSPNSRLRASVLDVLQEEGFIRSYTEVEAKTGARSLEIEDIRQPILRVAMPPQRVVVGFVEDPHRLDVRVRRQVLVAEHQDLMLPERLP